MTATRSDYDEPTEDMVELFGTAEEYSASLAAGLARLRAEGFHSEVGERRVSKRGTLTATSVIGARVYWRDERGFKSYTGSQAWRLLPLAE